MESRRIFIKKSVLAATTLVTLPVLSSCVNITTIKAKVPMKSNKIGSAAVLWYSQTGNTEKCGRVLAHTFEKKGITVISGDLRDLDKKTIADTDLIVIGAPVFYYDIPDFVKDFIQSLPDLKGIPVAVYVTFGGPEGNQHNAACSILEGLVQKNGVPVGLKAFMTISSYSLSLKADEKDIKTKENTILPDQSTYKDVRDYAMFIKSEVERGNTSVFNKTLTLREFSTYFGPEWWTKLFVNNHFIVEQKCVRCGTCVEKCPSDSIELEKYSIKTDTCVLCLGCINNCEYQAVHMEYNKKKVMGFNEFLEKNNLKFELPVEIRT